MRVYVISKKYDFNEGDFTIDFWIYKVKTFKYLKMKRFKRRKKGVK